MSDTRDTLPTSGDAIPAATSTPSGYLGANGFDEAGTTAETSSLDTAKTEAGNVLGTAKSEAAGVAGTAKEEVKNVSREAKAQVSRLYDNARQELHGQAADRQEKLAGGLRTAGAELRGLADGTSDGNGGVATDLVRQVSERIDGVASWLGSRDPGEVLDEVKRYARRRPIVFLAGATLAGILVGRLTRALAAGSPDDDTDGPRQLTTGYGAPDAAYSTGATGAAYGNGTPGAAGGTYNSETVTGAGGLGGATAAGDPSQRLRSSGSGDAWEVNVDDRSDTV